MLDALEDLKHDVLATVLVCFEDYTTDHRGDVGSWVRLAAVDLAER